MISYNIDSTSAANKLIRVCDMHKGETDININYGRTTIDGCSVLGVYSMIGHYVTVEPLTNDNALIDAIRRELE